MLRILFLLPFLAAVSSPLSDTELRQVVITLKRGMCYGECPVYNVRITGDGQVSYDGEMFVAVEGKRTLKIPSQDVRDLVATFEKAGYFAAGQYDYDHCQRDRCKRGFMTDAPSAVTSITIRGKTHQVAHNLGCYCAPQALFDVEAAIDKVSRADRWVGKERGGQRAGSEN
jgi:hypothetical protein